MICKRCGTDVHGRACAKGTGHCVKCYNAYMESLRIAESSEYDDLEMEQIQSLAPAVDELEEVMAEVKKESWFKRLFKK